MNRNPKLAGSPGVKPATARHVRAAPSSRSLNAGSHAAVTQVEGGAADIEFAASPASAARRVGGGHTGVHGAGDSPGPALQAAPCCRATGTGSAPALGPASTGAGQTRAAAVKSHPPVALGGTRWHCQGGFPDPNDRGRHLRTGGPWSRPPPCRSLPCPSEMNTF